MHMNSATLASTLLFAGCITGKDRDTGGGASTDSGGTSGTSSQADLFFILDNSSSMADESAALALNVDSFLDALTVDYQIGITTTSVNYTDGATSGIDPGEAGLLLGDPTILSGSEDGVADAFNETLLCEATCWSSSAVEDVPSYTCGDDPDGVISSQYLDCLCGADAWKDHCGSGTEEHLEATLLALCRAADAPPDLCIDSLSPFTDADAGSNPGLIRKDATTVVVIISDEGDTSRRLENGDDTATTYLDAFAAFDHPLRVAVVGPDYDPTEESFPCNSGGATSWGTRRLQAVATETSGFYDPIETDTGSDCTTADFAEHLDHLATLVNAL